MWELDEKHLQKDENIQYTDKPAPLSCILSYIWVALILLTVFVRLFIPLHPKQGDHQGVLYTLFLNVVIMSPAVYLILKRYSTRYIITNRSLITRVGIFTNSIKTVPFKHVTSVEVKETLLGKIFRYSHLIIDTAGSGKGIELYWKFVSSAHLVKKLIDSRTAK